MSAKKNIKEHQKDRNAQRRARALASERGINYQEALEDLRKPQLGTVRNGPQQSGPAKDVRATVSTLQFVDFGNCDTNFAESFAATREGCPILGVRLEDQEAELTLSANGLAVRAWAGESTSVCAIAHARMLLAAFHSPGNPCEAWDGTDKTRGTRALVDEAGVLSLTTTKDNYPQDPAYEHTFTIEPDLAEHFRGWASAVSETVKLPELSEQQRAIVEHLADLRGPRMEVWQTREEFEAQNEVFEFALVSAQEIADALGETDTDAVRDSCNFLTEQHLIVRLDGANMTASREQSLAILHGELQPEDCVLTEPQPDKYIIDELGLVLLDR